MAPMESADELAVVLERIKAQTKGNLSDYHKDLLKWTKNVDKRYAWVVLLTLWLIMFATLGPYRIYGLIFAKVTTEGYYTREEATWPVSMIITLENLMGPVVSIVVYYISFRQSMLIGGILLVLGNGLTAFSSSLIVDTLLLGVVQGIGYGFIFMPFMEVINNYFLKYRNMALGVALCGGTLSVFGLAPLFKWLLDEYPWRNSYLALGGICCIIPLMVPLLRPNPRPTPPEGNRPMPKALNELRGRGTLSRLSSRALSYQNSSRRQSTILIARKGLDHTGLSRKSSVISINPFASSVGLERKISRGILADQEISSPDNVQKQISKQPSIKSFDSTRFMPEPYETISLSEIGQDSRFEVSMIWSVLKTPAFHLIWFTELIYFWVFSIYCLVMVDYGVDRGLRLEEAETLLQYQSTGELIGRIILTTLVDMGFMPHNYIVVLNLLVMAGLLSIYTVVSGFLAMATTTTALTATTSLLYVLLNGLLVEHLGEQQVTLGYGMASFISGALMIFRPQAIGFFRDQMGSYDMLMLSLAGSCAFTAVLWALEPMIARLFKKKESEDNFRSVVIA